MNNTTQTGHEALDFIDGGLEVATDIEQDVYGDDGCGISNMIRAIAHDHGVREILAVIHDAALSAAEVHEEENEIACLRLQVFCNRLRSAMDALK